MLTSTITLKLLQMEHIKELTIKYNIYDQAGFSQAVTLLHTLYKASSFGVCCFSSEFTS